MQHSERILFVDDDAPVRTAFARSLRATGLNVDLADTPESALELAEKTSYAVIVSDYRMPRIDGLDLIEQLRQTQPDATYMLVSGECDLSLALQAVNEHNVSYVLPKPWDPQELAVVLRRSMDAHWERVGYRLVQKNMIAASKELSEQRKRLEEAVVDRHAHVAETLLGALHMRGHETAAHCRRVAGYALILAEALGLKGKVLAVIEQGALLHDVGKIGIPDQLMAKQGALTDEEWAVTRSHCELGGRLLEGFDNLYGAREIVRQHHEHWDGSGYPRGLRGEEICLGARIFAVADTVEAITSDRPYRRGAGIDVATAEILRCSATHFDPEMVAAFCRVAPERWLAVRAKYPEEKGFAQMAPPPPAAIPGKPIA